MTDKDELLARREQIKGFLALQISIPEIAAALKLDISTIKKDKAAIKREFTRQVKQMPLDEWLMRASLEYNEVQKHYWNELKANEGNPSLRLSCLRGVKDCTDSILEAPKRVGLVKEIVEMNGGYKPVTVEVVMPKEAFEKMLSDEKISELKKKAEQELNATMEKPASQ